MAKAAATKFAEQTKEIIAALDIMAEYRALGLVFASDNPRQSGKIEAYAMGRDDKRPSAWVDVNSGYYGDSSSSHGETLSLFDFAAKYGSYGDWKEARRHYAHKAGVQLGKGRPPERPDEVLEFIPWSEGVEQQVKLWCLKSKPGTSLEAIRAAGGRVAYYPCYKDKNTGEKRRGKYKVIVVPAYGPGMLSADPVAWVAWNITGKDLEVFRGKDREPDYVKMKSIGPTFGTLMNIHSLSRIESPDVEVVWKTAGPTDMLALMTLIPPDERDRHLVTCNASTETGDIPDYVASQFAGKKVFVIHDADDAGETGAVKWLAALGSTASEVRHVRLPYEVAPKKGKDIRDWIADGKTYRDTFELSFAETTRTISPQAASEAKQELDAEADTAIEKQVVRALQLDVLGEYEDGGGIKVFSEWHRKNHTIKYVSKLAYEDVLQICGPPAKASIYTGQDEPPPGMHAMKDVRQAVALLAGYKRIGEQTELGLGCWQGMRDGGVEDQSVILVGAGEAAEFNGDNKLRRVTHPRCRGQLLDLNSSDPWYDFDRLDHYLKTCDKQFSISVMHETIDIFNRWKWRHQKPSPIVMSGLVFATWLQTLWTWRPQVAVTGASRAGKSTLFSTLEQLFGDLAVKSSQSSAAGIRQYIRNTSRIILCDEFDSTGQREEILNMLRASGGGDKTLRGTPGQKGQSFGLRHIAWVAGIDSGMKRDPDKNRFIQLELVRPSEQEQGKLRLPSPSYMRDLGQKILAISISHIHEAKALAAQLKDKPHEGIDYRVVESYSVPAAMLSVIQGYSVDEANGLLGEMLAGLKADEHTSSSDEADLMHAILSSHVHTGKSMLSVAQLLEAVHHRDSDWEAAEFALAKVGIKFDVYTDSDHPALSGQPCFVIAYTAVSEHLLKRTNWEGTSIDQILQRIPGAIRSRRRVGGQRLRVLLLSQEYMDREFFGVEETEADRSLAQTELLDY